MKLRVIMMCLSVAVVPVFADVKGVVPGADHHSVKETIDEAVSSSASRQPSDRFGAKATIQTDAKPGFQGQDNTGNQHIDKTLEEFANGQSSSRPIITTTKLKKVASSEERH